MTTSPEFTPMRNVRRSPCAAATSSAKAANRRCISAAAATARSASSSATSGMPKNASIPSPMNLATVPAWASTTSCSSAW